VALLSEDESLVLISGLDPSAHGAEPFWVLPGGGLEDGEPPEEAARREAYEELGVRLGDLGPPVWRRHASFVFDGALWEQDEVFFVVRCPRFEPVAVALTEAEMRWTTGARWWSLDELASTTELIFPARLAQLVRTWLSAGPPIPPTLIE
jgi:8-oxo-dGTP pyrophosphatase MutT (NUDIX family)